MNHLADCRTASRQRTAARRRDQGAVLVLALFLLGILTFGVAATWHYLNFSNREAHRQENSAVTRSLAEAGLDNAVSALRRDRAYAGEENTPLGEGIFSVQVTALKGGQYRLVSTSVLGDGTIAYAQQTLIADLRLDDAGRILAYSWGPAKKGDAEAPHTAGRKQS